MTKAILELANQLGTNLKTLTVDHGKEFANYQSIEKIPACRCTLPMLILRMNVVVMRIVIECYGDLFLRVSQLKRLVMMN